MSAFLKMGLNRQNMAIEKATLRTDAVSDAAYEYVKVDINPSTFPAPGPSVPAGRSNQDGSVRVQGSYPILITGNRSRLLEIDDYYIENTILIVEGNTTTWDSLEFLVF